MNTTEMQQIERGVDAFLERFARDDRLAVRVYLRRKVTARRWKVIGREFGLTHYSARALAARGRLLVVLATRRGCDRDTMERTLAAIRPNLRRMVDGYESANGHGPGFPSGRSGPAS